MNSEELFATALKYEENIRDLYVSAQNIIDDKRGKAIFRALAQDEQSHVTFLKYSLANLKTNTEIDISKLESSIPSQEKIKSRIEDMKKKIPGKMLGDVKRVLATALQLEVETSDFYKDAYEKSDGAIKAIFEKFLVIENRHIDVVQIELDYASNSGAWFDFMEIDME
jgi:rubrerythrin